MNGILIVDKPEGWTSHDVVAKLRGIYREKRIGHSGTLDPMATGVLVVFLGRATRAVELCENDEKTYMAGLRLGLVTNTQDITGQTLETMTPEVTEARLSAVLEQFTGPQSQVPPMYSAVKVQGQKLYELARKGRTVERKPRNIVIHELRLVGRQQEDYLLKVCCSKGTYVRTLCHDIGQMLGCGGCMSSLRRCRRAGFPWRMRYLWRKSRLPGPGGACGIASPSGAACLQTVPISPWRGNGSAWSATVG